jgi:hypothetical protein
MGSACSIERLLPNLLALRSARLHDDLAAQ